MIKAKAIDVDGLYPQQRLAHTAILNWFKSDRLEFTLSGYAGTGKTHVIAKLIQTIGKQANCCITAPTHKALRVVERQVGVKGKTLHALHGLRMNVDLLNFDIENPQYDPMGTVYIQNFKLLIIDESSMVNADLFEFNRQASIKYDTKLLYVGDPLQLSPINEVVGKAFTDVVDRFVLTDIVRQKDGNDMLDLYEMLRDDILNATSNCAIHLIKSKDTIVGTHYKVMSPIPYTKEVLGYFNSPAFTGDIDFIRQACFTRLGVTEWNQIIRKIVVPHASELLDINDVLTAYSNQIDSFKQPVLMNSDDYILDDIDKYVDDVGIATFAVNLLNVVDRRRSPKLLIMNHTNRPSVDKITALLNHLHYQASVKKAIGGYRNYYKFKNSILLMQDITLNENNKFKTVTKDIDYGYALTIHKLQGSTTKNIAVDLRDIIYPSPKKPNFVTDVDTRNRLLYVALSRATDNAIIKY